ncbi:MAG: HAMP domain-containing protein [Burkholderiales bacterium]|nr:HAMP domain-containing protein [Burkholderiales bacterium]
MRWLRRFDTLFVRLFLLMWLALVASHLVAWNVVAGHVLPGPEFGADGGPPVPVLPSLPPGNPFDEPADEPPRGLPRPALWLDYGLRAFVIGLAAALGARWLSTPMRRLSVAAGSLSGRLAQGEPLPRLDAQRGTAEVRAAAAVFNTMAERLQQQFDARGMHLAAVSHDLRTPLTRLRLRLEALPPGPLAAAQRDLREIDELLDATLAVLREQNEGAPPAVVDLPALLQALADDLAEQGQVLTLQAMPEGLRVRARPAALRRVLANLVGNALRHGGNARVGAGADAQGVVLWVDDDGRGIPPAQLDRVFEPWVRLAPDAPRGGHGLGLAIARELAARDGATLWLANRPQGGLRASLRLPAANDVSGAT